MGRHLDNLCGPVPRVVVAADLKALKPNDWLTMYHGTTLSTVPQLINGFDATKVKHRNYGGPRHKGLFVTPSFRLARSFASYGPTVLEMVVRAKNLHGTDYSGVTGRQDPRREEIWRDKHPDSFRPYLSESLSVGGEPQALLQGLVAPRQIKRVWHAPKSGDKGQWYSRKEFLDLGLDPSANSRDRQDPLRDLGFDRSHPNYDYDEFIDAMVSFLGGNMTQSRVKNNLATYAEISMIPGRSDTLAEIIELNGTGFEPRAAERYADRFREQLAAEYKSRSVAASTRRVASVSGFMSDYKKWTAPAMRPEWRQWWTQDGKLVPLRGGSAEIADGRFAANTVIWPGDSGEAEGDVHFEFITTNSDRRGQGLGAAVVKAVADLADKHGVTVSLEPMQKGYGGLTTPQLDSWYRRLGWDTWDHPEYGEGPVLIRYPKRFRE